MHQNAVCFLGGKNQFLNSTEICFGHLRIMRAGLSQSTDVHSTQEDHSDQNLHNLNE